MISICNSYLLTNFEGWNERGETDEQEEQVEEELELIEEHHWDEGEDVVLLVLDSVRRVATRHRPPIHLQAPFLQQSI